MEESRFSLVFAKLAEIVPVSPEDGSTEPGPRARSTRQEFDEIDELRRFSLEVAEPLPVSYTIS